MDNDYIFRFFSNSCPSECGFVIEGFFITAYHVIDDEEWNSYIVVNNKKIILAEDLLVYKDCESMENRNFVSKHDLAIFLLPEMQNLSSPLSLGEDMPNFGSSFISKSFITKHNPYSFFGGYTQEELLVCEATINEERTKSQFAANTSAILKEGSSGSPLLDGNEVIGMLLGEEEKEPYVCFLSSKIIKDAININYGTCNKY